MVYLAIAIFAIVGFVVVSRLAGGTQERALKQYAILERRFYLKRQTFRSKWGKGIGERCRLQGDYHGYPIAIYSHFHGSGSGKQEWTSLTMELLFAGDIEFDLAFSRSSSGARFEKLLPGEPRDLAPGIELVASCESMVEPVMGAVLERLAQIAGKSELGVFRLAKGFLEYRESGLMLDDAFRIRFQEALLIMGELGDALSVFVTQNPARR